MKNKIQGQTDFLGEIMVDNFASGGGASTGIELATGQPVTIATYRQHRAHCRRYGVRPWSWVRWLAWRKGWWA